jgi:hypothetical protein
MSVSYQLIYKYIRKTFHIMVSFRHTAFVLMVATTLVSCGEGGGKSRGPIVLGDSTMIVTETDPNQLKDLVADLKPDIPPAKEEEPEQTKPDTAVVQQGPGKPPPAVPPGSKKPAPAGNMAAAPLPVNTAGLRAEFKEVSVVIPGLNVKQAGSKSLMNASGAVFTHIAGNIEGATMQISGNVTKVSQRYQSIVVLKSDQYGDLPLDALTLTTGWDDIKPTGKVYRITDLEPGSLRHFNADARDVRTAVQKMARRRRLNSRKTADLLEEVRKVKSANQKPLIVVLRSVMWKINGKDEKGRLFSKQIRVDIPL